MAYRLTVKASVCSSGSISTSSGGCSTVSSSSGLGWNYCWDKTALWQQGLRLIKTDEKRRAVDSCVELFDHNIFKIWCTDANLLFHFKFNSKNGVCRVHFVQRVDFLKCILKLFCRVDLKSKHIAATLKQNTCICVQGTEAGKKLNISEIISGLWSKLSAAQVREKT